MTITDRGHYVAIDADPGKALRKAGSSDEVSTVTSVAMPKPCDPNTWEDCEYGEPQPSEDATEADKDAALRRFGVEV